jgi:uncharacterized membrane protein
LTWHWFERHKGELTFGERCSDRIATFGGSWKFIGIFASVLFGWMALNGALAARAFDPYPYILLNLVLSCLAAIQAPIIMMSQKRQETRDRAQADAAYATTVKSKEEIEALMLVLQAIDEGRLAAIERDHLAMLAILEDLAKRPAASS